MIRQQDAYDAHQLARFMRPDAARWIRPDAVRFLKSGESLADAFPGVPGLEKKYSPDQPRDDHGRWTDRGRLGSVSRDDPRVVSDTDPDAVRSDQQYAQNRWRGGGRVIIVGQQFELTPAQGARLSAVQARAEEAIARVQEIPNWRPQPSVYETPEGLIRAYETDAAAAQARANYLAANRALPGPYSGDSRSARGPGRDFTAEERAEINRIGAETGCHTCGTKNPGTRSGNFVIDHQPPNILNFQGRPQRLYPHCLSCSAKQGSFVKTLR